MRKYQKDINKRTQKFFSYYAKSKMLFEISTNTLQSKFITFKCRHTEIENCSATQQKLYYPHIIDKGTCNTFLQIVDTKSCKSATLLFNRPCSAAFALSCCLMAMHYRLCGNGSRYVGCIDELTKFNTVSFNTQLSKYSSSRC